MGSMFSNIGIDSLNSVDDTITYLLFCAPTGNNDRIRNLQFKRGHTLRNIDGT